MFRIHEIYQILLHVIGYEMPFMDLSMLSCWGGGGEARQRWGFDSSHCPVVGTFDRFNGFSSNILLTFSCYFDNPEMP